MKYAIQTRRRTRGLTLLEVGMALALSAIVITGMAMYASSAAQKMKRRGDAQHLAVVAQASEAYLVKHQGDFLASGGALDPTQHALGTIVEVPVSQLVSDGEVSPSVSSKFGDGQNLELMLQAIANPAYQPPPASQTVPQYLVKGLVISYGGIAFTDDQAGEIVNLTGAAGGYPSTKVDTRNIDGSGGAWQEPLASWNRGVTHAAATGHVMALVGMSFGATGTTDDKWLAREVIDQGAAPYPHNTMQTDINMNDTLASHNSYSLLGASSVQANEYVGQTPGADINIGSITATPNINIGSANSTNQILLQTINSSTSSAPTHLTMNGNSAELGSTGGSTLNLPSSGASIWAAAEQKINVNDSQNTWTVLDSRPGDLRLTAPPYDYYSGNYGAITSAGNAFYDFVGPPSAGFYAVTGYPTMYIIEIAGTSNDRGGAPYAMPALTISQNPADASNAGRVDAWFGDAGPEGSIPGEPADIYLNGWVYAGNGAILKSDRRLKYDLKPLTNALDDIERLNGYTFKWKKDDTPGMGVIAQEVEKVFPNLVRTIATPKKQDIQYKGVNYDGFIAPLIEAVKTLHHILNDAVARIDAQITALQQDDHTLQTQVQTLTEQNTALKAELAQQHLDLIKLKYAIHQPLSADERTLCGAACTP